MSCKYCEKKEYIVTFEESKDFEGYVWVEGNDLVVDNDYQRTLVEINYCPMCGVKLEKEASIMDVINAELNERVKRNEL
ncbi:hypothetical protein I6N96_08980 [Enterococcus sp. BWM-S5]|uniref:Uncharacterized protein n=1 Tax=Enterococcus larvae TaxID=2794352 RepID=A0ABS4CKF2_9ENTE|nr:hypothetical protein [Enterococcus larvae]MBP1046417.1 hypothetical protein [Enterococcus larvae]